MVLKRMVVQVVWLYKAGSLTVLFLWDALLLGLWNLLGTEEEKQMQSRAGLKVKKQPCGSIVWLERILTHFTFVRRTLQEASWQTAANSFHCQNERQTFLHKIFFSDPECFSHTHTHKCLEGLVQQGSIFWLQHLLLCFIPTLTQG